MNISVHMDQDRLWGTRPVGPEERALKRIVKRFFTFDSAPLTAWLLYARATGNGEALITGRFRPKAHAERKLAKSGIGIAKVDQKFHALVLAHGPEVLRWNGHEVVANGN
jgi:hypothetical protein